MTEKNHNPCHRVLTCYKVIISVKYLCYHMLQYWIKRYEGICHGVADIKTKISIYVILMPFIVLEAQFSSTH